jgi:dCTP deaminase
MSALIYEDIIDRLDEADPAKRLTITPILNRDRQVGAASVDLRLGSEFLETPRQSTPYLDPFKTEADESAEAIEDRRSYVPLGNTYVLHPGQFVLGATLEFLVLPGDISGQVLSRSSWGRVGLLVATAVAVHPGFRGVLTLELVNAGSLPIVLRPGLRVAQLQLWSSARPTSKLYQGKYDAPLGPQSNRLVAESKEREILNEVTREMNPGHAEV